MNREEAQKLSDSAIDDLAAQVEQGHSETLITYLNAMSRFHRYSFGNIMLIAFQNPDATHVAGFHTWRSFGRCVRKGEHGIAILAPLLYRRSNKEQSTEEVSDPSAETIRGFKVAHVFDVSQTEGNDLPAFSEVQGDASQVVGKLKSAIAGHGITLLHESLPAGTYGVSIGGSILIRPDMAPAQEFAVLVHEFAHELLHKNGKDRPSKTVRETEAEAVSYVVCRAAGLEPKSTASDYIQLYRGTKDTLISSLEAIRQTATGIILQLRSDD